MLQLAVILISGVLSDEIDVIVCRLVFYLDILHASHTSEHNSSHCITCPQHTVILASL